MAGQSDVALRTLAGESSGTPSFQPVVCQRSDNDRPQLPEEAESFMKKFIRYLLVALSAPPV
jgi:hypothetical protein